MVITEEKMRARDAKIVELKKNGLSYGKIAEIMGITQTRVWQIIKAAEKGIERTARKKSGRKRKGYAVRSGGGDVLLTDIDEKGVFIYKPDKPALRFNLAEAEAIAQKCRGTVVKVADE